MIQSAARQSGTNHARYEGRGNGSTTTSKARREGVTAAGTPSSSGNSSNSIGT